MLRALAADARLLDAAERRLGCADEARVDGDHAVVEALAHAPDAGVVAGEEIRGQAERRVVGNPHGVGLALEAMHGRDGAEGLLVRHLPRHIGAGDDGRQEERAAVLGVDVAAQQDLAAARLGVGDVARNLLEGRVVDQRADRRGRVEPRRDVDGLRQLDDTLDERVVNAALDEHAVSADARLPRVAVLGDVDRRDCVIEVGVVEHEERCVATELERDLLDGARALLHEELADLRRARERELADDWVRRHLAADLRCVLGIAGDDAEDTGGDTDALGELGHSEGAEWRLLGGLEHHRAADGERGCRLAGRHRRREIPRRDADRHADRLAQHDEATLAHRRGDRLAVDALCLLAEPLEE